MKKTLSLFALLICCWNICNAQLKLTPKGLVDKNAPQKDYIVLSIPGKNKVELFKASLSFFNSAFAEPEKNVSSIENESINVIGIDNGIVSSVITEFGFNLEFKDDKIKVNPSYSLYNYSNVNGNKIYYEVYTKKGVLKKVNDKQRLEEFFNKFIALFKKEVEKKVEDW